MLFDLAIQELDLSRDRARAFDPALSQALSESIESQGLLYPVLVRQVAGGFRLVDGRHRIGAFTLLGRETIPAILSRATSDDEARLDEVMANLARKMIALDFCQHLFELRAVWNRLHPQETHGGNRRSEDFKFRNPELETPSFREAMADAFGLGKTAILEAVAIWEGLSNASRTRLRGTKLAGKKTELKALSEESPARQTKILDLILGEDHPDIGNVAAAIDFLSHGVTPTAVERKFLAVSRSFGALDDLTFDNVLAAHEGRVIASLKRRGVI